jgi:hypothetical protein
MTDAGTSIVLIDSSSDSLTVSWPSMGSDSSSTRYVLQYKKDTADSTFETLTDKLTSTQARKRNLLSDEDEDAHHEDPKVGFYFRVTSRQETEEFLPTNNDHYTWITHTKPFYLMGKREEAQRMDAPTVTLGGSNLSLRVTWRKKSNHQDATVGGYELQMRENEGGAAWFTIATALSGLEVKKKNLQANIAYQFRVRPTTSANVTAEKINNDDTIPFSPPSQAVTALGLSQGMAHVFKSLLQEGKLLRQLQQLPVDLEDALGGKEFVLLYASAHWCPPCRYVGSIFFCFLATAIESFVSKSVCIVATENLIPPVSLSPSLSIYLFIYLWKLSSAKMIILLLHPDNLLHNLPIGTTPWALTRLSK